MTLHKGDSQGLGALSKITISDMRAWMAQTRSGDVGPRSMARKLSAVKAFYRWLAEREGFEPTAVLSTRSPKFPKKLPRPLAIDAAQAMIDSVEMQSRHAWVAARDVAVLTLLWGCGLRISEALGLKGPTRPCPRCCASSARAVRNGWCPCSLRRAMPWMPICASAPLGRNGMRRCFAQCAAGLWRRGRYRRSWRMHGCSLACLPAPHPTHCATALPRICWMRGRSACDPRAFGPCLALDHAGLYGCRYRASDGCL